MEALALSVEGFLAPMKMYLSSNSGYVSQRQGLSFGLLATALGGVAAMASSAEADACGSLPPCEESGYSCSSDVCDVENCKTWDINYYRDCQGTCWQISKCRCSGC